MEKLNAGSVAMANGQISARDTLTITRKYIAGGVSHRPIEPTRRSTGDDDFRRRENNRRRSRVELRPFRSAGGCILPLANAAKINIYAHLTILSPV